MRTLTGLLSLVLLVSAQRPDLHKRIATYLDATAAEWVAVRRDLHQHPELSGQEARTAKVVAD